MSEVVLFVTLFYLIFLNRGLVAMDINHDAHEGLQLCGESVRVPEKSFKKLLEITFDIILGKKDESSFDGINITNDLKAAVNKVKIFLQMCVGGVGGDLKGWGWMG